LHKGESKIKSIFIGILTLFMKFFCDCLVKLVLEIIPDINFRNVLIRCLLVHLPVLIKAPYLMLVLSVAPHLVLAPRYGLVLIVRDRASQLAEFVGQISFLAGLRRQALFQIGVRGLTLHHTVGSFLSTSKSIRHSRTGGRISIFLVTLALLARLLKL